MFQKRCKLSREAINALPLYVFQGSVTVVRQPHELRDAIQYLSTQRVLGFDTETRPAFRKGRYNLPSLLQLAGDAEVFLFHFSWIPLAQCLAALLEDSAIIKVGVAVNDDLCALQKVCSFTPNMFFDLSKLASEQGVVEQGLRGLAAYYLRVRISKGVRCSNWSNKELSPRQVRYAATDAWISREIYLQMQKSYDRVADLGTVCGQSQ